MSDDNQITVTAEDMQMIENMITQLENTCDRIGNNINHLNDVAGISSDENSDFDEVVPLFERACLEYTPDKLDVVRDMLDSGEDVDTRSRNYPHNTMLWNVVDDYTEEKFDLVKLLVSRGADVDTTNGGYPEHGLLQNIWADYAPEKLTLAVFLLDSGMDMRISRSDDILADYLPEKREMLEMLLEYGIDLDSHELFKDSGYSSFSWTSAFLIAEVVMTKCPEAMRVWEVLYHCNKGWFEHENERNFVKRVFEIYGNGAFDEDYGFGTRFTTKTTMFEFILNECVATFSNFTTRQAHVLMDLIFLDVNEADDPADNDDHVAHLANIVLKRGFRPAMTDDKGRTLLHRAAKTSCVPMIRLMCSLTDVDALDDSGRSAWSLLKCCERGRYDSEDEDMFDEFVRAPGTLSVIEGSRVFMEHDALPFVGNNNLATHLAEARNSDIVEIVEYCYKNTDIDRRDDCGDTILHDASRYDNVVLIEYLLGRGSRTDLKNSVGDIPLLTAMYNGGTRSVVSLIRPEDMDASNDEDMTAVDLMGSDLARYVAAETIDTDPSLSILKHCVRSLPFRDRKKARDTLLALKRTPIPRELFAKIVAYSL